jgi:benzil reductase ((S)-benzoin forming)
MSVDTLVWISGASSGLGAALPTNQPFANAHVVDISRSGGTPGTEHLPADLADPVSWPAVEAHFHAQLGQFGGSHVVFVHAAGTLDPIGFAGEVDTEQYRQQILLNAAAPLVLGHSFISALSAGAFAGRADLVMITSGAAQSVYPGWSGYGPAKAAVDHWVRTVGAEQEARGGGCRVVSVGPGVVDTAMQTTIRGANRRDFPQADRFVALHEKGMLTSPDDAAKKIWSLLDGDLPNGAVTDVRS